MGSLTWWEESWWEEFSKEVPLGGTEPTLGLLLDVLK